MNGEEYNEWVQEVVDFLKDFEFTSLTEKIYILPYKQQTEFLDYKEVYGEYLGDGRIIAYFEKR